MLTCFQILTDLSCVHQFLVEETEENGPTRPRAGLIRQRLTLGNNSLHSTPHSQLSGPDPCASLRSLLLLLLRWWCWWWS
jgi:hypothetical protein